MGQSLVRYQRWNMFHKAHILLFLVSICAAGRIKRDLRDDDETDIATKIVNNPENEIEGEAEEETLKTELDQKVEMVKKEAQKLKDNKQEDITVDVDILTDKVDVIPTGQEVVDYEEKKNMTIVITPLHDLLDIFGSLVNTVTDSVTDIVDTSLDLVSEVSNSNEFKNVTRSVGSLVDSSAGLLRRVASIKKDASSKILARIDTALRRRRIQERKVDDEEDVDPAVDEDNVVVDLLEEQEDDLANVISERRS